MTLHFIGGATSEVEVKKEGRKYIYFKAKSNLQDYRVVKDTGMVEISPYWNKEPKMFVTK